MAPTKITRILLSSQDAQIAQDAASDLGIDVTRSEVSGAGGVALVALAIAAVHDPYVQGAFFGFLISRGITIETKGKDGIRITIKSLKSLKKAFKDLFNS
jgi:hypothetical protein